MTSHIIRLQVENFMRVIAVDISPDGFLIPITGKNAAGKSSVINAIWAALQWRTASHSIPEPVRRGQDTATVRIDLGDLIITRTWNGSGSKLQVTARDGALYKSPQAILDKFVSEIGFDPLEFVRMQPRDQRALLVDLLKIDFSDYETEKETLLADRLEAAQIEKSCSMRLLELPSIPLETPDEEISASELIQQIQNTQGEISQYHGYEAEREYLKKEISSLESDIRAIQEEISSDLKLLKKSDDFFISHKLPDITHLQGQLTNIEQTNKHIRIKQQRKLLSEQLASSQNDLKAYDAAIKDIDQKKRDTLAAAKFPVPGLSFDESGILLNGVPFAQASSSEQIRVSLAMGIAMNPDLKVLLIRDGNALDSDSLKMVEQMAHDANMQIWMERVDETRQMGIVIENGSIRDIKQVVL